MNVVCWYVSQPASQPDQSINCMVWFITRAGIWAKRERKSNKLMGVISLNSSEEERFDS